MTSTLKFWLILVAMLTLVYGSFAAYRATRHDRVLVTEMAPLPKNQKPLESFVLTDQSGEEFHSESLKGHVWVGSFFFTNCPGSCLQMNRALAAWRSANPTSSVRLVSITCDPANDTPQALATYAEFFGADLNQWTFLTGDMNLIRRIGNDFFEVAVEHATHSDRAFVVDRQGVVRGRFRLTDPDQLERLNRLIAVVESEPIESSQNPEEEPQRHDEHVGPFEAGTG